MSAATSRGRISAKCAIVAATALFAASVAQAESPDKFVEYIQSDGTQYINLGDVLSPNVNVTIDYQVTKANGSYYNIFGYVRKFAYITWNWFYVRGKRTVQTSLNLGRLKVNIDSSRQTISFKGKNQSLESTDSREGSDTSAEAYVFWGKGSSENKAIMKLWSCVISNGNEVVMSLYPCVKGTKAGLYDLVSREIFYDATGTGNAFTCGSEVDPPDGYATEYVKVAGSPARYGTPNPDYGMMTNVTVGTAYTFTCPVVATNAAETIAASCAGYTFALTNGEVYAGMALSTSIVYSAETACSTLTWLWEEQFKATVVTRCDGEEATAASAWSDLSGKVTVTAPAAPKAGFAFSHWEGTGVKSENMTLASFSTVLSAPGTMTAVYVPVKYVKTPADGGSDATGDGTAVKPFESAEKAVASLGDDGGVVEVAAGTYALTNQVVLRAPVILRGASRETTIFDVSATSGVRCVSISNANARVSGLTFKGSKSVTGGGVMMHGGRVEDCGFTGHGSYALATSPNRVSNWKIPIISRCVFTNNTGTSIYEGNGARGIYVDNCLVANNSASCFYNDYNNYWDPNILSNCTFVVASGTALSGNSKTTLFNCIVVGKLSFGSSNFEATHTCFSDVSTNGYVIKKGCILVEDPLFEDTAAHNYHLRSDSPCVNAGCAVLHDLDLDRKPRTSGTAPDMGCYELDLSSAACTLTWDKDYVFAGDTPNFTVKVFDDGAAHDYAYTVTLTEKRGGSFTTNVASFAYTFDAAGLYDISVTAIDKDDPTYKATYTKSAGLYAAATTNYVTKLAETAGEWPYDTPAKATSDLQKAFDVTVKGSTVAFVKGTHPLTEQIFLDLPITLAGEGGRENTALDVSGTNGVRCIVLSNANAVVSGLTLRGARKVTGGGVLMCGGKVEDCAFTDCGSADGAAISTWGPYAKDASAPVVSRCYVTNNPCGSDSSAILAANGKGQIYLYSCVVAHNTGVGLRMHHNNSGYTVENCTFIGNTKYQLERYSGTLTLKNSIIVWKCSGQSGFNCYNTCFSDVSTNNFNIKQGCILVDDPLFEDAAAHNYRLRSDSPCVNAGCAVTQELDLDCKPRTSGAAPDMGAYELDLSSAACTLTWDKDYVFAGDTPNFTVKVFDDGAAHDYAYTVTLTEKRGGSFTTNVASFAYTFDAAGLYDISITAIDKDDPTYKAIYTKKAGFYAAALTNYVTKLSATAGEWPYDTPAKATSDLQKAFDVTVKGSTVAFVKGTHPLTEQIFLDLPITLAGEGGREATALDASGQEGVRCVVVSNKDAVVSGLTLRGARKVTGGGVLMCGGKVEDCTFTDNGSAEGSAISTWSLAKDASAPVISRCYVTNNPCGGNNSAVHSANGKPVPRIDSCLIAYNTGVGIRKDHNNSNTLQIDNCTLISNSVYQIDRYAWYVNLKNCIVMGNSRYVNEIFCYNTCFSGVSTNGYAIRTGCILVDNPKFKNFAAGDYRLRRHSPCVGAGLYEAAMDAKRDLDGRPRAWKESPKRDAVVDMGCYQSQYTHGGLLLIVR